MTWVAEWMMLHWNEQWGRLMTTALVLLGAVILNRILAHYVERASATLGAEATRTRRVYLRNAILVACALTVITLWSSKIAGFAFSVAALTGAILLVSKELLMSVLGHLVLTTTRPYRMGDWIEVGGVKGKVVDMEVLSTTVVESVALHQSVGTTVTFPNSVLLTTPVRNLSATAPFLVVLYRIVLPLANARIEQAETAALAAAEEVTGPWREAADIALQNYEKRQFIDLPSSKPRVMWESPDGKSLHLLVRFSCPADSRGHTEQAVFRAFWARYFGASGVIVPGEPD